MGVSGGASQSNFNQNTVSKQAPPSWASAAGQQAVQAAQSLQQMPFAIPPQPIAPFTAQQSEAFQEIQDLQGKYAPYIGAGGALVAQGAQNPFLDPAAAAFGIGSQYYPAAAYFQTPQGASQYFNAEAAGVMPQLQNIFGQQMAQTTGNAVQQAGGTNADRIALAQSLLANQQGLSAGQTLSQLMGQAVNQGQQAGVNLGNLGTAWGNLGAGLGQLGLNNAQLSQQAGVNMGNLGNLGQTMGLQGAQAELQAGTLQQQQQQNQLNSVYNNVLQEIAWPFQTTQYLGSMASGVTPSMGGMGTSQTAGQVKSSQMGGSASLSGLGGMFAPGGRIGMAAGGDPVAGAFGSLDNMFAGNTGLPKQAFEPPKQDTSGGDNPFSTINKMLGPQPNFAKGGKVRKGEGRQGIKSIAYPLGYDEPQYPHDISRETRGYAGGGPIHMKGGGTTIDPSEVPDTPGIPSGQAMRLSLPGTYNASWDPYQMTTDQFTSTADLNTAPYYHGFQPYYFNPQWDPKTSEWMGTDPKTGQPIHMGAIPPGAYLPTDVLQAPQRFEQILSGKKSLPYPDPIQEWGEGASPPVMTHAGDQLPDMLAQGQSDLGGFFPKPPSNPNPFWFGPPGGPGGPAAGSLAGIGEKLAQWEPTQLPPPRQAEGGRIGMAPGGAPPPPHGPHGHHGAVPPVAQTTPAAPAVSPTQWSQWIPGQGAAGWGDQNQGVQPAQAAQSANNQMPGQQGPVQGWGWGQGKGGGQGGGGGGLFNPGFQYSQDPILSNTSPLTNSFNNFMSPFAQPPTTQPNQAGFEPRTFFERGGPIHMVGGGDAQIESPMSSLQQSAQIAQSPFQMMGAQPGGAPSILPSPMQPGSSSGMSRIAQATEAAAQAGKKMSEQGKGGDKGGGGGGGGGGKKSGSGQKQGDQQQQQQSQNPVEGQPSTPDKVPEGATKGTEGGDGDLSHTPPPDAGAPDTGAGMGSPGGTQYAMADTGTMTDAGMGLPDGGGGNAIGSEGQFGGGDLAGPAMGGDMGGGGGGMKGGGGGGKGMASGGRVAMQEGGDPYSGGDMGGAPEIPFGPYSDLPANDVAQLRQGVLQNAQNAANQTWQPQGQQQPPLPADPSTALGGLGQTQSVIYQQPMPFQMAQTPGQGATPTQQQQQQWYAPVGQPNAIAQQAMDKAKQLDNAQQHVSMGRGFSVENSPSGVPHITAADEKTKAAEAAIAVTQQAIRDLPGIKLPPPTAAVSNLPMTPEVKQDLGLQEPTAQPGAWGRFGGNRPTVLGRDPALTGQPVQVRLPNGRVLTATQAGLYDGGADRYGRGILGNEAFARQLGPNWRSAFPTGQPMTISAAGQPPVRSAREVGPDIMLPRPRPPEAGIRGIVSPLGDYAGPGGPRQALDVPLPRPRPETFQERAEQAGLPTGRNIGNFTPGPPHAGERLFPPGQGGGPFANAPGEVPWSSKGDRLPVTRGPGFESFNERFGNLPPAYDARQQMIRDAWGNTVREQQGPTAVPPPLSRSEFDYLTHRPGSAGDTQHFTPLRNFTPRPPGLTRIPSAAPGSLGYQPYERTVGQIESGGNRYARTGSNYGINQFGRTDMNALGLYPKNIYDPHIQSVALAREAVRNAPILQKVLGREPTGAELYIAHQQGVAGGPALLQAAIDNPNGRADQTIARFYKSPYVAHQAIMGQSGVAQHFGRMPTNAEFIQYWKDFYRDKMLGRAGGGRIPMQDGGENDDDDVRLPGQLAYAQPTDTMSDASPFRLPEQQPVRVAAATTPPAEPDETPAPEPTSEPVESALEASRRNAKRVKPVIIPAEQVPDPQTSRSPDLERTAPAPVPAPARARAPAAKPAPQRDLARETADREAQLEQAEFRNRMSSLFGGDPMLGYKKMAARLGLLNDFENWSQRDFYNHHLSSPEDSATQFTQNAIPAAHAFNDAATTKLGATTVVPEAEGAQGQHGTPEAAQEAASAAGAGPGAAGATPIPGGGGAGAGAMGAAATGAGAAAAFLTTPQQFAQTFGRVPNSDERALLQQNQTDAMEAAIINRSRVGMATGDTKDQAAMTQMTNLMNSRASRAETMARTGEIQKRAAMIGWRLMPVAGGRFRGFDLLTGQTREFGAPGAAAPSTATQPGTPGGGQPAPTAQTPPAAAAPSLMSPVPLSQRLEQPIPASPALQQQQKAGAGQQRVQNAPPQSASHVFPDPAFVAAPMGQYSYEPRIQNQGLSPEMAAMARPAYELANETLKAEMPALNNTRHVINTLDHYDEVMKSRVGPGLLTAQGYGIEGRKAIAEGLLLLNNAGGFDEKKSNVGAFIKALADPHGQIPNMQEAENIRARLAREIAGGAGGLSGRSRHIFSVAMQQIPEPGAELPAIARTIGALRMAYQYDKDYMEAKQQWVANYSSLMAQDDRGNQVTFDQDWDRTHPWEQYAMAGIARGAVNDQYTHMHPEFGQWVREHQNEPGFAESLADYTKRYHLTNSPLPKYFMTH